MFVRGATDDEILTMWRAGKNTCDIARAHWTPEYLIAERLPCILQKDRQDKEWDSARRRTR